MSNLSLLARRKFYSQKTYFTFSKMKQYIIVLVAYFATSLSLYAQNKNALQGKIIDQKDGMPLNGASVYFPDLKIGATTDTSGFYKINKLPKTTLLIEVNHIGYQQIVQQVDLATITTLNFSMKESITELGAVVITGLSKATERSRTPSPISVITTSQLQQSSASNIIDALAKQPGISQVTTGPGISKPVIRGLGYNRVVVVSDGIRQEGQQWGDEHGIEVDEFGVNRVEVLKGPASLIYGSDAMAGVIQMLAAPTLPIGTIKGNFLANYQTNNGLIAGSFNLGGNQKGVVWDFRYTNKMAHAYRNKYDGYVFNSGFREDNLKAIIGINKSWGYSNLNFSSYSLHPGIVSGKRDSITGQFVKQVAINDSTSNQVFASESDFKSYFPFISFQKTKHYKLVSSNNFYLAHGTLNFTLGWQQNQRKEYEEVLYPEDYGLYFFMNTFNYDFRYNYTTKNRIDLSFGTNGMYQNSQNRGEEFLVPDYNLFDFGLFGFGKKSWEKWTFSGGFRFDLRKEQGKDLWLDEEGEKTENPDANSIHQFSAFHSQFRGLSGSIGASYQINENLYTKLNFSKGFRAPNIAEISANGAHEGTVQNLIGSPNLKSESSYQIDYAFGIKSEHLNLETDLFYNNIANYIYLEKLLTTSGVDSLIDGYQTFKYTQGNAHLYGAEIVLDLHPHPLDWLHFENSFSYIQSIQRNQPDSMRYLPLSPAPKWQSELRASAKEFSKYFTNAYIKVGLEHSFQQNHYYRAYGTETATSGYTLLNAGVGADVVRKKRTLLSVFIHANNLTNVAYQSHLSRLKYLEKNNATGRSGVFNMGRNFSLKIIVPFQVK